MLCKCMHRVIKIAKKMADSGRDVTFAISNDDDFSHELSEFGLTAGDKPVVAARNSQDQKFVMDGEFTWVYIVYDFITETLVSFKKSVD